MSPTKRRRKFNFFDDSTIAIVVEGRLGEIERNDKKPESGGGFWSETWVCQGPGNRSRVPGRQDTGAALAEEDLLGPRSWL